MYVSFLAGVGMRNVADACGSESLFVIVHTHLWTELWKAAAIEELLCCSTGAVTESVSKSCFISRSRSHLRCMFLQGMLWAWFPAPAKARKLALTCPLHLERRGPRGLVEYLSGLEILSLRKILLPLNSSRGSENGLCLFCAVISSWAIAMTLQAPQSGSSMCPPPGR